MVVINYHKKNLKDVLKKKHGDEFIIKSSYEGSNKDVLVTHSLCNETFPMKARSLLRGHKCFKCSYKNRKSCTPKSNEKFLEEVYEQVGDEYTFLEEYKGNKVKLMVRHNKCGNEYPVSPNKFLSLERRCPHCKEESKGERIIHEWLHENKIPHKREVTFKGCVDKNKLPFDFIMKLNGKYTLIEFDGKQHFAPSFVSDKEEARLILENTQRHDKIKTDFARKNIDLIRINYKQIKEIKTILDTYKKRSTTISKESTSK